MKLKLFFIVLLLLNLIPINHVLADGFFHAYDPNTVKWELINEGQQLVAINYDHGVQSMILAVGIGWLKGEKAVWMFPVPASSNNTFVDLVEEFPYLFGDDVKEVTRKSISEGLWATTLSQVYPIFPFSFISGTFMGKTYRDLTIHQHIEKAGMTVELVSTKDSDSLYNYLTDKGLDLPLESKAILNEYVGKDYSFVVCWISNVTQFNQALGQDIYGRISNLIGVYISFPTDKIYFPLKPTSVYSNMKVPISIYVIGHVTPDLYPEIRQGSQVNYLFQEFYLVPNELSSFFNWKTRIEGLKYTEIEINAPSENFKEDLWIKNSAPLYIAFVDFLNTNGLFLIIIVFALDSCLASLLSGMIVFRDGCLSKKKLFLFGLWNFLTLIGFCIATIFLKTKKLNPKLEKELKSYGSVIISDSRKFLFVFLFTLFFLGVNLCFQALFNVII